MTRWTSAASLMTKNPKHLAVLNAAAEKAGWDKPLPRGPMFRGIAQNYGFGSYTAAVAEVSVQDGQLKMHRIVAATDPGLRREPRPDRRAG